MIAKLWDELFRIKDRYRKGLDNANRFGNPSDIKVWQARINTAEEIDTAFQRIWDRGETKKEEITGATANDPMDKLVLGIDALDIYEDPQDGQIFFELEGKHFDSEEEVLAWIVRAYNHDRKGNGFYWIKAEDGEYLKTVKGETA